ncbi:MAG: DUF3302 domain-containing protein [Deltaproteobacteria bacterium]|nr:DUF3302 domain-containing protein [Deltaproteobacteria bacterium]MBI3391349.1 DUF3302 domain-containing protein [Deltaproteobacteria bacterium]
MLGFDLDFWDYATFAALAVLIGAFGTVAVLIAGLPGRIAIARKHPDAEAVKIMGWAGLLFAVPWIQAFIWAFKPTDIVDIRRFPRAERIAVDEEIARLQGATAPAQGKASSDVTSSGSHRQPPGGES